MNSHPGHLNTPRLIADTNGTPVWMWDQAEPFGVNTPDENPSALGAFEFPLRFPGQYADKETNLSYNYFRDCYDPVLGRYCQSDPIGLRGGLNTYAYVDSAPLTRIDPFGLDSTSWARLPGRDLAEHGPRNGNWCGGNWSGGQIPSKHGGKDGVMPPLDSLDRCCMVHDKCYGRCDALAKGLQGQCRIDCDRAAVSCLRSLDDDCDNWPMRPRPGTEADSQFYRDDMTRIFDERIKKWDRQQTR